MDVVESLYTNPVFRNIYLISKVVKLCWHEIFTDLFKLVHLWTNTPPQPQLTCSSGHWSGRTHLTGMFSCFRSAKVNIWCNYTETNYGDIFLDQCCSETTLFWKKRNHTNHQRYQLHSFNDLQPVFPKSQNFLYWVIRTLPIHWIQTKSDTQHMELLRYELVAMISIHKHTGVPSVYLNVNYSIWQFLCRQCDMYNWQLCPELPPLKSFLWPWIFHYRSNSSQADSLIHC